METLFHAKKFDIIRKQVRGSDGKSYDREIVVHPGAVVVLPLLPGGRIVMIDQHRVSIDARLLELPAGTRDVPDEPPAVCAARELVEETGYVAGRMEPLCRFYPSPGIMTELIEAFVATDLTLTAARPEVTENIRVLTLPLAEAVKRIESGEIVDAKTMITLMFYSRRMERTA